ncbi:MAG: gamma-glutamylcyclotransferase family protein [Cellulosilyticaceae bacterium]
MKTKIYAAYGSNMNLKQMGMRCPAAVVIGTGEVKDYRLTFRGLTKGVANIERSQEGSVPIVLWEITPECEVALDRYEGYPSLYTKKTIEVDLKDESRIEAMAYVMARRYQDYPAEPSKTYLDTIIRGYKDNKLRLTKLNEAVAKNIEEIVEVVNGFEDDF